MRFSDERVWFRAPFLPFQTLWSCWVRTFRLQPGGLRITSDMTLLVEQDAVCNIFQVLRVWWYDLESGCAPFHLFFELILSGSYQRCQEAGPMITKPFTAFPMSTRLARTLINSLLKRKASWFTTVFLGTCDTNGFPQCDSDHPAIRNSCGKGMKIQSKHQPR